MSRPQVSLVMPVRNERVRVAAAMQRLARDFPGCELIVVDGGSDDGTLAAANHAAPGRATVVSAPPGRARQMNAGAALATADVLWFVHVDTALDPAALDQLTGALRDPAVVGGGLTLRFDRSSFGLNYLARASNIRARRLHWVFGDQALFVRREVFEALGGYPDLPIMEDLELSRRLARRGLLVILPAASTASARRFEQHGTWRMLVLMQWLKALYFAGVDPQTIARRYEAGTRSRRTAQPHPPLKEYSRARHH